MIVLPWEATSLLAVFVILIAVTGTSTEKRCPVVQTAECRRNMSVGEDLVNVYSVRFCLNFLCDTKTDGGGWIIIQVQQLYLAMKPYSPMRRVYQDTYFNKTWDEYKHGFGTNCSDYWLGNKHIHMITETGSYELRIDMEFQSKRFFAQYEDFYIDSEEKKYRLHIRGFSENVSNDLKTHNDMDFSTADRDNDRVPNKSCAAIYMNGWWHNACHDVNLNGHFHLSGVIGQPVTWESLTTATGSLSSVEMKIRRITLENKK